MFFGKVPSLASGSSLLSFSLFMGPVLKFHSVGTSLMMMFDLYLCHFKSDEQRKENRDWTHTCVSPKNDHRSKTVPGVILLSISSQQDQCLVQQIQDRHSWFTPFGVRARLHKRFFPRDPQRLEKSSLVQIQQILSAGRYMMRLVTSCITGRRPQTPAGATCREPSTECMLTVSQPHVDLGQTQSNTRSTKIGPTADPAVANTKFATSLQHCSREAGTAVHAPRCQDQQGSHRYDALPAREKPPAHSSPRRAK